jgi:hypothetical protein
VRALQDWLVQHGKKKSRKKEVLVNRLFCAVAGGDDTDFSDIDSCDDVTVTTISDLKGDWLDVSADYIPDSISETDIDNYFLYQKHPTSGRKLQFQRHMRKANKFCNEHYVGEIRYHPVEAESDYWSIAILSPHVDHL